jgi:hypothetical protein
MCRLGAGPVVEARNWVGDGKLHLREISLDHDSLCIGFASKAYQRLDS